MTEAVQLFDEWAKTGRATKMARSHRRRAEAALAQMNVWPGDRCVDLGCGNGWATRWLAEHAHPGGAAVGVDLAPEMLALARAEECPGASFLEASILAVPLEPGTINHVFSMEALYYVDIALALSEAHRLLKPRGQLLVCTDFYEENPACHSWPADLGITMALLPEAGWRAAIEEAGFTAIRTSRFRDADKPGEPGTLGLFARRA